MGATAENTQREIGGLRDDMTATIDEIERRLRGGVKSVTAMDARVKGRRTGEDAAEAVTVAVTDNQSLVAVGGAVAATAAGYATFAALDGWRASQDPATRLRHGVGGVRGAVGTRLEDLRKGGVLLKLDPEKQGYVRVTDARLGTASIPRKDNLVVVKKLVWALMMAVFTALGSVVAKRGAAAVWQASTHEDPPDQKKKPGK